MATSATATSGTRSESMTESTQSALARFYCRQVLLRLVPLGQVQNVRITLCNFRTRQIFTLERPEILFHQRNTKSRSTKVTVEKRPNRAGATRLFCGKPPKGLRGRSRPGRNWRRPFFHGAESEQAKFHARFIKTSVQKRRDTWQF
jgi:hypothetical protein